MLLQLPLDTCRHIAERMWPRVNVISESDLSATYRIVMSPKANVIAALMAGDLNWEEHTGSGTLQTVPLISICSTAVSYFRPKFILRGIFPDVSFSKPVNIREPVIATVTQTHRGKLTRRLSLSIELESSGKPLFTERTLKLKTPAELRD